MVKGFDFTVVYCDFELFYTDCIAARHNLLRYHPLFVLLLTAAYKERLRLQE